MNNSLFESPTTILTTTPSHKMNNSLFELCTTILTSLISITILCYSTNLIGAYYIYDDIQEDIFHLWSMFYFGLLIFCLSLIYIKKLNYIYLYAYLLVIIGAAICGVYIAITVVNFRKFGFIMKYYYLLPFTSAIGGYLCIVVYVCDPVLKNLI